MLPFKKTHNCKLCSS